MTLFKSRWATAALMLAVAVILLPGGSAFGATAEDRTDSLGVSVSNVNRPIGVPRLGKGLDDIENLSIIGNPLSKANGSDSVIASVVGTWNGFSTGISNAGKIPKATFTIKGRVRNDVADSLGGWPHTITGNGVEDSVWKGEGTLRAFGADSIRARLKSVEGSGALVYEADVYYKPLANIISFAGYTGNFITKAVDSVPRVLDSVGLRTNIAIDSVGLKSLLAKNKGAVWATRAAGDDSIAWGGISNGTFVKFNGFAAGTNPGSRRMNAGQDIVAQVTVFADSISTSTTSEEEAGFLFKIDGKYSAEDLAPLRKADKKYTSVEDGRTEAEIAEGKILRLWFKYPKTETFVVTGAGATPLGLTPPEVGKFPTEATSSANDYAVDENGTKWFCGSRGSFGSELEKSSPFGYAAQCSVSVKLVAKPGFAFNKSQTNWNVTSLRPTSIDGTVGGGECVHLDSMRVYFIFTGPQFLTPTPGAISGLPSSLSLGAERQEYGDALGFASSTNGVDRIEWVRWVSIKTNNDSTGLLSTGKVFEADSTYGAFVRIITEPGYAFNNRSDGDSKEAWAEDFKPAGSTISKVYKGKADKNGDSISFAIVYDKIAQPTLVGGKIKDKVYGDDTVWIEDLGGSASLKGLTVYGKEKFKTLAGKAIKVTLKNKSGGNVTIADFPGDSVEVEGSDGVTFNNSLKATGIIKLGNLKKLKVDQSPYSLDFMLFDSVTNVKAKTTESIVFNVVDSVVQKGIKLWFNSAATGTPDSAKAPLAAGKITYDSVVTKVGRMRDSVENAVSVTTLTRLVGYREAVVDENRRIVSIGNTNVSVGGSSYFKAGRAYVGIFETEGLPGYGFDPKLTPAQLKELANEFRENVAQSQSSSFGDSATLNFEGSGLSADFKKFTYGFAYNYVSQPVLKGPATDSSVVYKRSLSKSFDLDSVGNAASGWLPANVYLKATAEPWNSGDFPGTFRAEVGTKTNRKGKDVITLSGDIDKLLPRDTPYEFKIKIEDGDRFGRGIDTAFALNLVVKADTVRLDTLVGVPLPVVGSVIPASNLPVSTKGKRELGLESITIIRWTKGSIGAEGSSSAMQPGESVAAGEQIYAIGQAKAEDGYIFAAPSSKTIKNHLFDSLAVGAVGIDSVIKAGVLPEVDGNILNFAIAFKKVSQPVLTADSIKTFVYGTSSTSATINFPAGFPTGATLVVDSVKNGTTKLISTATPITGLAVGNGGAVKGTFELSGLASTNVTTSPIGLDVYVSGTGGYSSVKPAAIKLYVTIIKAPVTLGPLTITSGTALNAPVLAGTIGTSVTLTPTLTTGAANNTITNITAISGWSTVTVTNGVTSLSAVATSGSFAAGTTYAAVVKATPGANWSFAANTEPAQGIGTALRGSIGSSALVSGTAGSTTLGLQSDGSFIFAIGFPGIGQPAISAAAITSHIFGTGSASVSLTLPENFPTTVSANGKLAGATGNLMTSAVTVTVGSVVDGKRTGTFSLSGLGALAVAGSPHTINLTVTGASGINATTDLALTVVPRDISGTGSTVTITPTTAAYTGKRFAFSTVTVTSNSATVPAKVGDLVNWDTTVTLGGTNVGTTAANVLTITGRGNYTGSKEVGFAITAVPAPVVAAVTTPAIAEVYYPTTGTNVNLGAIDDAVATGQLFTIGTTASPNIWRDEPDPFRQYYIFNPGNPTATPPVAASWEKVENNTLSVPEEGAEYKVALQAGNINGNTNFSGASTLPAVTATSGFKTLRVLSKSTPRITISTQPAGLTIVAGKARGTLKVVATAGAGNELEYQWERKVGAATVFSAIAGQTTDELKLTDIASDFRNTGSNEYRVVVKHKETNVLAKAKDVTSNAAVVTIRDGNLEVAPIVATVAFPDNQSVPFTFGGEFKVPTLPTITIGGAYTNVAGVASNYKLTQITYTRGSAVVTTGDKTSALTTHTGVTAVGEYKVKIHFENIEEGSVGYGLYYEKEITFTVNPRSLSNAVVTVAALTGDDAIYNGQAKDVSLRTTVTDNGRVLTPEVDYVIGEPKDWTDAGTNLVWVEAVADGNYSGSKSGTFTVAKKAITLDKDATYEFNKPYDGNATITVGEGFEIAFSGLVTGEALRLGEDYTITGLKFNNASVGERTVSATIALIATGPVAKNYTLSSGAFASTGSIIKGPAVAENFRLSRTLPAQDLYTGKALGIGTVNWVTGIGNSPISGKAGADGKFTVLYNGSEALPIEVASYEVTVKVNEGQSFEASEVSLGTYNIVDALVPTVSAAPSDTTIRETQTANLRATAFVDDGSAAGITKNITYQWYIVPAEGEPTKVSGGANQNASLKDLKEGSYTFLVEATYKPSASVQATTTARSNTITVNVLPAPKSLEAARVTVSGVYTYNGQAQVVQDYDVRVTLNGVDLTAEDYTFVSNSVAAGTGVVTVTGVNAYKDKATGTFTIAKKQIVAEDITYKPTNVYNAKAQGADVKLANNMTGFGKITVLYGESEEEPTNAGEWPLIVSIADGANLIGVDTLTLGTYRIIQVVPSAELFEYARPKDVAWTGQPQGIGAVKLIGDGTGYGTLTVLYNGVTAEPVDSGIEYVVTLNVEGGINYTPGIVELGRFTIQGKDYVGIASGNRELPTGTTTETAVIAPVAKVTASLTVGPNPVNSGSAMNIYWNGSKNVKGQLVVFGSNGKKVAKVTVTGKGNIGAWTTANVPEGTYLLKGVLKTDSGEKVKVSTLVGVAK